LTHRRGEIPGSAKHGVSNVRGAGVAVPCGRGPVFRGLDECPTVAALVCVFRPPCREGSILSVCRKQCREPDLAAGLSDHHGTESPVGGTGMGLGLWVRFASRAHLAVWPHHYPRGNGSTSFHQNNGRKAPGGFKYGRAPATYPAAEVALVAAGVCP